MIQPVMCSKAPTACAVLCVLQWEPGLEGAIKKLDAFLFRSLALFQHDRAKVDRESTSQLSPWIHQGTLSVRYIYYRVGTQLQRATICMLLRTC